ncbi:hypothetical protein ACO0R3_001917 [Hanseniaspora guilliermondii]
MIGKTSLDIIKSIKQNSKNNDDLNIIFDLLKQDQSVYFPDKETFCLEHIINKINSISNNNEPSSNQKSLSFVNNHLLYKIIDTIYGSNRGFNQILKNLKIGNVLFNVNYNDHELVNLLTSTLLKIIIQSNVSLTDVGSEKFIINFLKCFNLQHDCQNAENFIMNLSQIVPFSSFISKYEIFFLLIKTKLVKIKSMIENEFFFNEKNFTFDLNIFIENMKSFDFVNDDLLVSTFELICDGYVQKSDKYPKEILDKAFNKCVEISTKKHIVFIECLKCISNILELKKLNDIPTLKTLETFINDEEMLKIMNENEIGSVFLYSMENNIEVGYKYHEKICSFIKSQSGNSQDVLKSLIKCFVDYKELDVLIKYFIKVDITNIIKNEQSANLIINQIHNLTGYQLYELLTSNDISKELENIVVKGMHNVNTIIFIQNNKNLQDWLKNSIFKYDSLKNWEFMYHALNLYSNSIIPNISAEEDAIESYVDELNSLIAFEKQSKISSDEYYYFAIMKTYEISIEYDVQGFDDIAFIITEFINNVGDIKTIGKFLLEFISIINNSEKTGLFTKIFFQNDANLSYFIANVINATSNDIYEEDCFVKDMVKQVVTSISTNVTNENILHLLRVLPLQCFSKHDKQVVINSLKESSCYGIICKFLTVPTFKSSFEKFENFVELFSTGKEQIGQLVWNNYINNINDDLCFEFISRVFNIFDIKYLKNNTSHNVIELIYYIIKTSHGAQKTEELMRTLVGNIIKLFLGKNDITQEDYLLLFGLYQIDQSNSSINHIIVKIFESKSYSQVESMDMKIVFNLYAAYCHITKKSYHHIIPIFFKIYSIKDSECEGLKLFLKYQTIEENVEITKNLIEDINPTYGAAQLSIIKLIIRGFNKDENEQVYCKIFTNLLNKLLYNINLVDADFLDLISNIVITKSWMLKQYTLEMMVPFLIKTISESVNNDSLLQSTILLKSLKIISDFVNYQQYKLSRRTHLINSFIVFCMDFILQAQLNDAENLYKSLNRLIMNFIDPINIVNNNTNQDSLKSNVLAYKQELRKYIYPILLKYINALCINYTGRSISIKMVNDFRNGLKLTL